MDNSKDKPPVSETDDVAIEHPASGQEPASETTTAVSRDVTDAVKVVRTTVTTTTTSVTRDDAHPDNVSIARTQQTFTTVSAGDGPPSEQDVDVPTTGEAPTSSAIDIEALLRDRGWENRARSNATSSTDVKPPKDQPKGSGTGPKSS